MPDLRVSTGSHTYRRQPWQEQLYFLEISFGEQRVCAQRIASIQRQGIGLETQWRPVSTGCLLPGEAIRRTPEQPLGGSIEALFFAVGQRQAVRSLSHANMCVRLQTLDNATADLAQKIVAARMPEQPSSQSRGASKILREALRIMLYQECAGPGPREPMQQLSNPADYLYGCLTHLVIGVLQSFRRGMLRHPRALTGIVCWSSRSPMRLRQKYSSIGG